MALERNTVLFRDPGNAGRRFVPVLLEDCKPPDTLRRYKYVDFRKTEAVGELVEACRGEGEGAIEKEGERKGEPVAVLERKLTGHKGWVWSVAVSRDGTCSVRVGRQDRQDLESGDR